MNARKGMVLAEALVGASVLIVFISALVLAQRIFIAQSSMSIDKTQSALLAEEGIEVAKFLRDENWANIACASTTCGPYGLQWDTTWSTTTSAEIIDEKFYRTLTIDRVCRNNSTFAIASSCSGAVTNDPNTKKVTISVSWSRNNATTTKTMATYLTNFHE